MAARTRDGGSPRMITSSHASPVNVSADAFVVGGFGRISTATSIGWAGSKPSMARIPVSRRRVRASVADRATALVAPMYRSGSAGSGVGALSRRSMAASATGETFDGTRTASRRERPGSSSRSRCSCPHCSLRSPRPRQVPASSPAASPAGAPVAQPDAVPQPSPASPSAGAIPSSAIRARPRPLSRRASPRRPPSRTRRTPPDRQPARGRMAPRRGAARLRRRRPLRPPRLPPRTQRPRTTSSPSPRARPPPVARASSTPPARTSSTRSRRSGWRSSACPTAHPSSRAACQRCRRPRRARRRPIRRGGAQRPGLRRPVVAAADRLGPGLRIGPPVRLGGGRGPRHRRRCPPRRPRAGSSCRERASSRASIRTSTRTATARRWPGSSRRSRTTTAGSPGSASPA